MKKIALLCACLLLTVMVFAGPVSREQAQQIAAAFMSTKSGQHRAPSVDELRTQAVLNAVNAEGQPYLYAVTATGQGGYVLVCGDDRMRSILGYSKTGTFVEESLPPHLRAWLQGYVDEMKQLDAMNYDPSAHTNNRAAAIKTAISPMITTQWNQDAPYNNSCPDFFDYGKSVTGCVATAMAQVVYHAAKVGGLTTTHLTRPIDAYTCNRKWNGTYQITVPTIPAETTLNWSAMRDTYASTDTDAGAAAVATLMLCCGASVHMDYANADNKGSISSSMNAPGGLTYFDGFAATALNVDRSSYTYSAWIELIYSELKAGRPVLYGGQSSGGGHAFVVDGYDGDELFHVNWGWGGFCDDYYALSVLNPNSTSGIGASSSNDGYSMDQNAVIGIQAGSGGSTPVYMSMSNFRVDGQQVEFKISNDTGIAHNFDYGIGIYDNSSVTLIGTYITNEFFKSGYGYTSKKFPVPTNPDYANTTKTIIPISRETGTESWMTGADPQVYYYTAVYDANGVPTLTAHPAPVLSATISVTGSLRANEAQQVNVTVTNSGEEFCGPIYLYVSSNQNSVGSKVTYGGITVIGGKSQTTTFKWTPGAAGTYYLNITSDADGKSIIGSGGSATIESQLSLDSDFIISAMEVANSNKSSIVTDGEGNITMDVYSTTITFSPTVKNNSSVQKTGVQPVFSLWSFNGSAWVDTGYYFTSNSSYDMTAGYTLTFKPMTFNNTWSYGKYKIVLKVSDVVYDTRWILNLAKGYTAVNANGEEVKVKFTDNAITVADNVAAADFRNLDITGLTITPNSHSNTLYYLSDTQTVPASLSSKNVVKNGVASHITLTDGGGSFAAPIAFTTTKMSYTRTFDQFYNDGAGWTTIVLPFAATKVNNGTKDLSWVKDNCEFFIMEFVGENGTEVLFSTPTDAATLKANTPYIIALPGANYGSASLVGKNTLTFSADNVSITANAKASVTCTNYKMVGTTKSTAALADIYTLNDSGTSFVNGTSSVSPFRAYFASTSTAGQAAALQIGSADTPTGIRQTDSVVNESTDAAWYTLDGRRLQGKPTQKGLYIQKGKKVAVQ